MTTVGQEVRPTPRGRVLVAIVVAVFTALLVVHDATMSPGVRTDFDQTWFAANAILDGRDPYALIGPGREFDWVFLYYYPLTAPLVTLPLAWLPLTVARIAFIAVPAGLLAWLLSRDHYWKLVLFASGAFISAVKWVQWSPWLACALLLPGLGFLCAIKPNFGVVLMAGFRTRRAVVWALVGSALVTVASLVAQPAWPLRWLGVFGSSSAFVSLVQYPEGLLLLLALLRWRRADARLLLALSIVPITPVPHSILLLLLIPRSPRVLILLGIATNAMLLVPAASLPVTETSHLMGRLIAWFVALPVLVVVLGRPNVGPVPGWLDRWLARAPAWVRGAPGPVWDPVAR